MSMDDEGDFYQSIQGQFLAAAGQGDLKTMARMVNRGVDVNCVDPEYEETALIIASRTGYMDVVHFLASETHCDLDHRPRIGKGYTAIMNAAYYGHNDIARYLAHAGANTTLENNEGQSVFDIEPCLRATKAEMTMSINEGLQAYQHAVKQEMARLEDQKDTALDIPQVCTTFLTLYRNTCTDFNQEPKESIIIILKNIMEEKLSPYSLDLSARFASRNTARFTDEEVFPLFEVLGHLMPNAPFHSIDLGFNNIRNHGANAIAVFLTHTKTLKRLVLRANAIEQIGCQNIAKNLSSQMTLHTLDLNTNPIGDAGICTLADILVANTTITDLDIGNTDMGTLALVKVAVALTKNKSITKLDISNPILHDSLQEETTIHISKALSVNQTLTSLSMAKHRMRCHGAKWLAFHLRENSSLVELNLSCNQIASAGVAALAEAVAVRRTPCEINLNHNHPLKGQPVAEINLAIEENTASDGATHVTYTSSQSVHQLSATRDYVGNETNEYL